MPTSLITGASSGIGYELAKVFAEHGHNLVLLARRREPMEKLADECRQRFGVRVELLTRDLSLPNAAQETFEELSRSNIDIDYLVNNAGFGIPGPFADSDLRAQLSILQVNVTALLELSRLFLAPMIQRRSGGILNVASVAGFVPGPYMSMYYASKAFVVSHSIALSHELKHTGVTVSALCPGPTATEFQQRAGMARAKLWHMRQMTAESVARIGYRGFMRKNPIIVTGVRNKLMVALTRLIPKTWLAALTGSLNRGR